jgi:uncharacterized repeat protein (TIGR03803 family)
MYTEGVFRLTRQGELTTLYSFCAETNCADGASPYAGVVLGTDGFFYGTTAFGGEPGNGTSFKLSSTGVLTTLYTFCSKSDCADGAEPLGALVEATDGNFYGTTVGGGEAGQGTVFRLTPSGNLTTLYSFCFQTFCSDGAEPSAGLIQASDGELYGTTTSGGNGKCRLSPNCGTVFKITLDGALTTLHIFCAEQPCTNGANPYGGLIEASDGNLYGTTQNSIFRINRSGVLTKLDTFCKQNVCTAGDAPMSALIQATDGKLYGTNSQDGPPTVGTIFDFSEAGITALYNFCSQSECDDGALPIGGLLQATNGLFYGTTSHEGICFGCGTVFSFDVGLDPFVAFVHPYGKVGQAIGILGQGLTGTSSVSFNGTPATFTVVSDTFIKANVPAEATDGLVTVTGLDGTLESNTRFQIIP